MKHMSKNQKNSSPAEKAWVTRRSEVVKDLRQENSELKGALNELAFMLRNVSGRVASISSSCENSLQRFKR